MQSSAASVDQYVAELPADRKQAITKLLRVIRKNLPHGFHEAMTYGMPGYVVPFKTYPKGYHVDPRLPLGFIAFASQKNFIALYHMGIYSNPKLLSWFVNEYPKHSKSKLDMGKSCIRFKKIDELPYDLIGELVSKMTVEDWIECYERNLKLAKQKPA